MNEKDLEQTKILREILKWIKIEGINRVRQIMEDEFKEEMKILIYHFSDGRSSDDIEKLLNKKISDVTIRSWWKKWAKLGIMELHPDYKKRYKRIFNLEDFGIEIPNLPDKANIEVPSESKNKEVDDNDGKNQ